MFSTSYHSHFCPLEQVLTYPFYREETEVQWLKICQVALTKVAHPELSCCLLVSLHFQNEMALCFSVCSLEPLPRLESSFLGGQCSAHWLTFRRFFCRFAEMNTMDFPKGQGGHQRPKPLVTCPAPCPLQAQFWEQGRKRSRDRGFGWLSSPHGTKRCLDR